LILTSFLHIKIDRVLITPDQSKGIKGKNFLTSGLGVEISVN